MPHISLRIDDDELTAWRKQAEAKKIPLSIWVRLEINALIARAAPQVQPAAPKPYVKRGPKLPPVGPFLDLFADKRFPSGQRRYRHLVEHYPDLADDEAFHRVYEAERLKGLGKPDNWHIDLRPVWAYSDKMKKIT